MCSGRRRVLEDILEPLAVDLSAVVALSHFWRICNHLVWSVTTSVRFLSFGFSWTLDQTHKYTKLPSEIRDKCRVIVSPAHSLPLHVASHRCVAYPTRPDCILDSVFAEGPLLPRCVLRANLHKVCLPPPSSSSTRPCHFLQTPTMANHHPRQTKGEHW